MSLRSNARWIAFAVLGAGLLFAVGLTLRGLSASTTPAESYVSSLPRAPGTALPMLFRAPAFDLAEAGGARVTSRSLLGKVWIVNFIFTQCTTVCPVMTARLAQLERQLRSPSVRFVSVSVDPEHDSPEALRAFAAHWPPEPRWLLASPTRTELDDIARGLRVAVAPSGDPADPILHSRLLTLVDGEGAVRAIYDSDDPLAWRRVANDAQELIRALTVATPRVAESELERLASPLARFGCQGCHDRPEVAPKLAGGHDRMVALASGETVHADDAYLRESILEPGRRMTAGYAPTMPSYKGVVSVTELDELVAAIHALPGDPRAAAVAARGPAEDPVCHMLVATVDPSLTFKSGEAEFHFCSHACLESFVARRGKAASAQ